MSAVTFNQVTKTFPDGFTAVDSLDLEIAQGEFLVLLGPSGCGKSTTLRMLAGLESVSSGEILFDGVKVNGLPSAARGIGMVFQSYALYPHMSVEENLSFGQRMVRRSKRLSDEQIAERIGEIAELLSLSNELAKKPSELSGGQRQRVAIGRALMKRPSVLLMDEPLSNLDATLRTRMRRDLRQLHEKHGTTTVYVTHDQVEAMTLADRIAIMSGGCLQQHAEPSEAYKRPANAFVAGFLGTPAANLITGEARGGKFHIANGSFALPEHLADMAGRGQYAVRPEHIAITPDGSITAAIELVENLGSEFILNLEIGGQTIRAIYRPDPSETRRFREIFKEGEVNISLASHRALFFREGADDG